MEEILNDQTKKIHFIMDTPNPLKGPRNYQYQRRGFT